VLGRFYGQEILGGSFPTVTAEKLSKHFCSTCTLVACILAVILLSYRLNRTEFGLYFLSVLFCALLTYPTWFGLYFLPTISLNAFGHAELYIQTMLLCLIIYTDLGAVQVW
jgi:hypothetical protein